MANCEAPVRGHHSEAPVRGHHSEAPVRGHHSEAPVRGHHDYFTLPEYAYAVYVLGFLDCKFFDEK